MISVKSRYILKATDPRKPALIINPLRRIGFAAVAVLLVVAAVMGLSAAPGSLGQNQLGTMLYAVLTLGSIVTAAASRAVIFDTADGYIYRRHAFFGVPVDRSDIPLAEVKCLRVAALRLIPGSGRRFEKKKRYYRLEVAMSDHNLRLEDGTDGDELVSIGKTLSRLIGKPFSFEEF
ncbi:MAG: hypothetical protein ACOCVC_00280 [Spirochaeta sp.]